MSADLLPVEFVATVLDSGERRRRLAAMFAELTAGPAASTPIDIPGDAPADDPPDDGQDIPAIPADGDGPGPARTRRLRREVQLGGEREPDCGGDHPEADPWASGDDDE